MNVKVNLGLLCFPFISLWLIQKTRATFSTNQIQTATWTPAFSRVSNSSLGFTSSSDWLLVEFSFRDWLFDYFGSGFTTLNWKALFYWIFIKRKCHNILTMFSANLFNHYCESKTIVWQILLKTSVTCIGVFQLSLSVEVTYTVN